MSARHVLFGHLRQLPREWNVTVVVPSGTWNPDWNLSRWDIVLSPSYTKNLFGRVTWEATYLPRIAEQIRATLLFSPNGIVQRESPVPQATLAQNPWCMSPMLHKSLMQKVKAMIQRQAYRMTQRSADHLVYNSNFMRDTYRSNAGGFLEKSGAVAYQGINEERFSAAEKMRGLKRRPMTIVSVSAMARWKGAERLVKTLELLHARGLPATLRLVGPWPDEAYRLEVKQAISKAKLDEFVTITGRVSDEQLDRELASARVYALLSRCESFGIPAVEAQAFGTPVVGTLDTAMAEIGADGGKFVYSDDIAGAADAIYELLTDSEVWASKSENAFANAERFRWSTCSKPLIDLLSKSA